MAMLKWCTLGAAVCASPVAAQELPKWIESPVIFHPAEFGSGEKTIREGEVLVEVPLRWAFAGKLAHDVSVSLEGTAVTLKRDEILPQVMIRVNGKIEGGRTLLCTRSKVIEKRAGTGLFAKLVDDLRDSLRDAQHCVEDSDQDGKADRMVVLGVGKEAIDAGAIELVALELVEGAPIPGGQDYVRLLLASVGKSRSSLLFKVRQFGLERQFDTISDRFRIIKHYNEFQHKAGLPAKQQLLGTELTLLDARREENAAVLRWETSSPASDFVVIPRVVQLTYGY